MCDSDTVHIMGIDCAADPSDIAVAFATPTANTLTIESIFRGNGGTQSRSARLRTLAEKVAKRIGTNTRRGLATLLAVDAPLGWPIAMGQALRTHQAGFPLPEPCAKKFFRRRTDRFVEARTGKTPIEVGANLIARVSHTALRLLALVGEQPSVQLKPAPLTSPAQMGRDVHVIEVYPALASPFLFCQPSPTQSRPDAAAVPSRSSWNTVAGKLKTAKMEEKWDETIGRLSDRLRIRWKGDDEFPRSGPDRDHGLDAILCAWTAWRFLQGKCVRPEECSEPQTAPGQLSREGWIWFDERTPDSIVSGSSPSEAKPD